jgi:hypothetical protein
MAARVRDHPDHDLEQTYNTRVPARDGQSAIAAGSIRPGEEPLTDRVLEHSVDWSVQPLDEVDAVIFIDAIVVRVRHGQVANRPIFPAIGATTLSDATLSAVDRPGW